MSGAITAEPTLSRLQVSASSHGCEGSGADSVAPLLDREESRRWTAMTKAAR